MPFRGLTMLKSRKLVIKGGLCYRFAMVNNRAQQQTTDADGHRSQETAWTKKRSL